MSSLGQKVFDFDGGTRLGDAHRAALAGYGASEQQAILQGNARRIYRMADVRIP